MDPVQFDSVEASKEAMNSIWTSDAIYTVQPDKAVSGQANNIMAMDRRLVENSMVIL